MRGGGAPKNGGQACQALGRSRGGFSTKIHVSVDGLGNPLRFILTGGQRHDITQAEELIAGYAGEQVLADKGYDSQEFREHILALGMTPVIPPRSNRKEPAGYDRHLYRERHLVECFINKMKHYRRIFSPLRNWTPDTWAFCISPPLSSGYAEMSTQPSISPLIIQNSAPGQETVVVGRYAGFRLASAPPSRRWTGVWPSPWPMHTVETSTELAPPS